MLGVGVVESRVMVIRLLKPVGSDVGSGIPLGSRMANENWSGLGETTLVVRSKTKVRLLPAVNDWAKTFRKFVASFSDTPEARPLPGFVPVPVVFVKSTAPAEPPPSKMPLSVAVLPPVPVRMKNTSELPAPRLELEVLTVTSSILSEKAPRWPNSNRVARVTAIRNKVSWSLCSPLWLSGSREEARGVTDRSVRRIGKLQHHVGARTRPHRPGDRDVRA